MRTLAAVATLLALLPALTAARSSAAPGEVIQPGALALLEESLCTLNWVYDEVLTGEEARERTPRVLIGTAAHCVSRVGERVSLATPSVGTTFVPGDEFGEVVHVDDDLDYALIEVDPEHHQRVDPAMAGHPGIPTGVSTQATSAFGDLMQFSGNGVGYSQTATTREERIGVLSANNGRWHWIVGSVTPGDSGGPIANLTDGGKAFGIATAIAVGYSDGSTTGVQAGETGVSVEGLLADAAAAGWDVRLRTVSR